MLLNEKTLIIVWHQQKILAYYYFETEPFNQYGALKYFYGLNYLLVHTLQFWHLLLSFPLVLDIPELQADHLSLVHQRVLRRIKHEF